MKIIAMLSAGLLATGSLAAVPAEAQRYGWQGQHDRGYDGYRDGRGDRGGYRGHGYDRGPRWHGRHGYRGDGRWNRGPRWRGGYGRVVCRDGYYGQRCVRVR